MSDKIISIDENITTLANQLNKYKENIILLFAFNGTGKTRLSVEYKNITKSSNDDQHAGVYYNAYSEDLFYWDNEKIILNVISSSLNEYHSLLDEDNLREKLLIYKPKFDFKFSTYKDDQQKGIESIQFFQKTENFNPDLPSIKISRGEERIFIWCFFLTLFDIQGWTEKLNSHFFIDDPISSLDDHNIFVTASMMMELIDKHFENRKIIITTHHVGFFSILSDWLTRGEKASLYKNKNKICTLKNTDNGLKIERCKKDVFLYHLELIQMLQLAINNKKLYAYHFATLRQVLENTSSFLGVGHFSYVLQEIGITEHSEVARIINTLSHKNVFRYEAKEMVPDNEKLFINIFNKLQTKYNFVIHV